MKRIISFAAVLAMVFGSAACQKEVLTQKKGDSKVTFNVAVPDGVSTKAFGDGKTVDELFYEVYVGDNVMYDGRVDRNGAENFVLELNLVTGMTYDLLFWAQKKNTGFYETGNLKDVKVTYDGNQLSNVEDRDAFFGSFKDFTPTGVATSEKVYLKRPFAQINFGSSPTDWKNAQPFIQENGLKSQVVLKNVYTAFDVFKGDVTGQPAGEITFKYNVSPATQSDDKTTDDDEAEYITYNGDKYGWIAMNYVLAPVAGADMPEVVASFVHDKNTENSALEKTVLNVPFKQNYKTNILGEIFTGGNKFTIIIEPGFVNDKIEDYPDYIITAPIRYAFEHGGTFTLDEDMTLSSALNVAGNDVTLDLNGYTLTFTNGSDAFYVTNGKLTIKDSKGEGTVKTQDKTAGYGVFVDGVNAEARIEGGHFIIGLDDISKMDQTYAGNSAVYTKNGGKADITGGKFEVQTEQQGVKDVDLTRFLINRNDDTESTLGGDIVITGGTFVKFDPSNNHADGNKTNYVASGYKVEQEGDNYTVVKEQ